MLEGSALHRGREYNRRTGCGKTARPGLHGGCRATGIPTVEARQEIRCTGFREGNLLWLQLIRKVRVPSQAKS